MAHLDPLGVFQLIDAKLKTSPHREQLSVLRRRLAGEVTSVPELVDETLAPGFALVMQAGGARRVLGRDAVIAAARGSAAGLSWAEADDLVVDDGVIAGHGRLTDVGRLRPLSSPNEQEDPSMAVNGIGALRGADEGLNHQIADTFATVAESDLAWTEKIWGSIARVDGSLQVNFGLGKYHNRGIIDGFGGVSRGREQWTVRGSRELRSAPEEAGVGPVQYEVVEPVNRVRFRLEPNEVQPVSFDVELSGVTPPFFEERNLVRNRHSGRIDVNVIRYHQGGWATGTITVNGETIPLKPGEWFGFRDHSWGVRQSVGLPPADLIPGRGAASHSVKGGMKWTPAFFTKPDGTSYETAIFLAEGVWGYSSAYVNQADGTQDRVRTVEPHISYDPRTRYVTGGELHLVMDSGDKRVIEVEVPGDSGFFLKTAGYGKWADHIHGTWRGKLHLDGEYIPDCSDDEHLRSLGQLRDTPIRVREGDAVGYGIMESLISGVWPELGLTAESDHLVSFS